jgi:hypothetical protein
VPQSEFITHGHLFMFSYVNDVRGMVMCVTHTESRRLGTSKYDHPFVSSRDWFQDPLRIPKSTDAYVPYIKCLCICIYPTHLFLYTLNNLAIIYKIPNII